MRQTKVTNHYNQETEHMKKILFKKDVDSDLCSVSFPGTCDRVQIFQVEISPKRDHQSDSEEFDDFYD